MANTNHGGKSTVGMKNFRICKIVADTDQALTYESDLMLVAGAIEATVTPDNADPDIQYADDIEYDVMNPDPNVTFSLTLASLPVPVQAAILGATIDAKGVMFSKDTDTPPYFACGWESVKSNGKGRKVWLTKCRAKPLTEEFGTKEGTTVNRRTGQVEFTAIKRTNDGVWKMVCDEDDTATATVYPTFLDAVYETPSGN